MRALKCGNCGSPDVQVEIRSNVKCLQCGATTDTSKEK